MQESLLNTVKKMQASESKVNIEELEILLNSNIEEVVKLCKKACIKPKTDSMGNAYFTKNDIDILKKMKELYSQNIDIQKDNKVSSIIESKEEKNILDNPNKKINFLEKAKKRTKTEIVSSISNNYPMSQLSIRLDNLENNLISKMGELLSEKMDGFDEIIVELIRTKTENENLRQQVNSLNKQVYILKDELASFNPLPFGFYTKKETDTL